MSEVEEMVGVQFARERLSDAWDEGQALVRANYEETGILEGEKCTPDKGFYLNLEAVGKAILFTARIEKKLIGYAIIMLSQHAQYQALLWAMQDVLYVAPEHRGILSARFLEWQDETLEAAGVDIVYRHVNAKKDYSRLLERMMYKEAERGYIRRFQ